MEFFHAYLMEALNRPAPSIKTFFKRPDPAPDGLLKEFRKGCMERTSRR
jgi:hypothetical protein